MKKVYVLLAFFGIWCLASALWYMFSVKGINSSEINPQDSALAIAEILIMTLVSVLIGFGIAWYLRSDSLTHKQKEINHLIAEINASRKSNQTTNEQLRKLEHTLERARETFREDFFTTTREKERLQVELGNSKHEIARVQNELSAAQSSLQNLQQINTHLERTLNKEQVSKHELEVNLEEVRYQSERKEHIQSDFISERILAATQIEKQDIDDLKEIKGIGAVIEKKLNMLGIVSFKQVSQLTNDAIEQISHTLKFFPDRIKRDHWVQQAATLDLNKIRKV
jgi:predicted flap endonuclease-1-like 5' DNA nuclease